jgi:hypothetical protein
LSAAVIAGPALTPAAVQAAPAVSLPVLAKPAAPAALKRVKAAAAKAVAGKNAAVPAALAPKTFAETANGEEAGILFDQSVARPGALAGPVLAAAADSEGPKDGLEPAKSPAPEGDKPAVPSPAGKTKLPRSMWGLFWGHHIVTVFGVNFHVLAQPFLVKDALGMGTAAMGLVRNIHMGSMAVVNFLPIGYLIDKTDYRAVFTATTLARALLMGAIPMLFAAGALPFTMLALIVAINPIFQSAMIVADGAARKSFLGKDPKLNKDAAATLGKWDSLAGMLMPLVAGWIIGMLVTTMGLGGYATAYGIYAALLLVSIPIYWSMVRDPRFPENDKAGPLKLLGQTAAFMGALGLSVIHPFTLILRWSFNSVFKGARGTAPAGRLALAGWLAREALVSLAGAVLLPFALLKLLGKIPALWRALRASRGGPSKGKAAWLADQLEKTKPTQGLAYILRNRILSILTAVMALEVLLIDALPFVLIPSLITDALGTPPTSLVIPLWAAAVAGGAALLAAAGRAVKLVKSWKPALWFGLAAAAVAALSVWPSILLMQVATAGSLMGLLFSVEYIGRFIPSARLEGEKGDAIIEKKGHGSFYRKAALASLLFWALLAPVYLTPGLFWINLAIVAGVLFTVQLFHAPVGIVMEPVKRAQMDDDKLARIESSIFMVDVAFESIGALFLGLLLDYAGIGPAVIATAIFLSITAILQYNVPKWIFPDGNHPPKTPPPAEPGSQAALSAPGVAFA